MTCRRQLACCRESARTTAPVTVRREVTSNRHRRPLPASRVPTQQEREQTTREPTYLPKLPPAISYSAKAPSRRQFLPVSALGLTRSRCGGWIGSAGVFPCGRSYGSSDCRRVGSLPGDGCGTRVRLTINRPVRTRRRID